MSIETVKIDYEVELDVLQVWIDRIGDPTKQSTGVPPENQMSKEYRKGWRKYLEEVRKIGVKMVKECEQAEKKSDTGPLKALLKEEIDCYDKLAKTAQAEKMPELSVLLKHEAVSRRAIIKEVDLPPRQRTSRAKPGLRRQSA